MPAAETSVLLVLAIVLAAPSSMVAALRKACDDSDARACAELSRRYRAGDGVERDMRLAVAAAEDGCESGEPALCIEAGRAVLRGEGVRRDPDKARELFSDACGRRTQVGCLDLALMYQNGSGVPRDPSVAVPLFDKACKGGEAAGCQLLGDARFQGIGGPRDRGAALVAYQRSCELETSSACTKVGDLLRLSRGQEEAPLEKGAAASYRKACAADEQDACTVLTLERGCDGRKGCLDLADLCSDYLAGYDVLAEPLLAREPCEKACQGGVGEACDNLGDMYEEGLGVARDEERARELRQRACTLGDRDACG